MLGWLNASLKSMKTRDEISTTLQLQSKINFFYCQDADQCLMLHPYLPQEQAAKTLVVKNIIGPTLPRKGKLYCLS